MEFRIADTFTSSLAKLSGEEQKLAKTTVFDLQANPANPGMQFHRIDKAKDKNFWSVRVGRDIRIIVHKTNASLLLCYVGHHDPAYEWAERRKLEAHPKTGAAQLVEIRETVREITVPKYVEIQESSSAKPPLFANISDDDLLGYGVPTEWLEDVRGANEDSIFEIAEHLPGEAGEALLDLATGVTPKVVRPDLTIADPFAHPDAQRRFRVMSNVEELERALEYPWDKWSIFLHPDQREIVEKDYDGPVRVSGSAGTGKTIVALHRAVFLARKYPDARVLLTTFSHTLANALRSQLRRLISNEPKIAERLEVHSLEALGRRLYKLNFGEPRVAPSDLIVDLLAEASRRIEGHKFSQRFLLTEWEQVVDAWQLDSWEAYRDVTRLGRKTRFPEKQRAVLWSIFDRVRSELENRGLITSAEMFSRLAEKMATSRHPPFEYAVVDEAQDITPSQLQLLAALGGGRANSLFFAGDLGQRIFQEAFSWKSLGVDVSERANTLKLNYRTSHQIRQQSDRLLAPQVSDVDGNIDKRLGTISLFNGPQPDIRLLGNQEEEIQAVGDSLSGFIEQDIKPHEIGVIVRSSAELSRAIAAVTQSDLPYKVLDDQVETMTGYASISTMHLAKGLEFRVVAVMACDDEIIPLQARIETVADDSDLEEVYETERHLLYVACTRARDHLLITSGDTPSEFIDDLRPPTHS